MSSKAKKRKLEYEGREEKRMEIKRKQKRIRDAKGIEELASAMGIPLK